MLYNFFFLLFINFLMKNSNIFLILINMEVMLMYLFMLNTMSLLTLFILLLVFSVISAVFGLSFLIFFSRGYGNDKLMMLT